VRSSSDNELGGRQAIQELFARLEVLLVAASLEDILKMKRLIWSLIAHEDGASDSDELRVYH
jgi:hypothetical protein